MVMKIIHYNYHEPITFNEPISMAIGYFDGLHLGHLSLANKVKEYASSHHTASALMTFSPNPLITLEKIKEEHYLTSYHDRAEILENIGIDYLIIVSFTKEVSQLSPEDFFHSFIDPLPLKCLVCGFDYHFGIKGMGDGETLKDLSKDKFPVYIQEEVTYKGEKISSTRIQNSLKEGNIELVNELLGRPYAIQGEVIRGRQNGRTIGFPTANIQYGQYAIPCNGVYAVKIMVKDKMYIGMCNIGYNPTFGSLDHPSMEVNIFDFDEDIYGENVKVYFYSFIRKEVKFTSPEHLMNQLKQDKERIIHAFKD